MYLQQKFVVNLL
uniref:Uncharacterized protein n=1 Tax=Arundo donax TaxID=35708 RepID=A0A0A9AT51_ARUDO